MVAERAVVRVLLHSHQLHGAVTQADLTRGSTVVGELAPRAHALVFGRHSRVGFVDERRLTFSVRAEQVKARRRSTRNDSFGCHTRRGEIVGFGVLPGPARKGGQPVEAAPLRVAAPAF